MQDIISNTKENFEKQLSDIDQKISSLQSELEKLREYKIKLQGGLETLEILSKENNSETEDEAQAESIED